MPKFGESLRWSDSWSKKEETNQPHVSSCSWHLILSYHWPIIRLFYTHPLCIQFSLYSTSTSADTRNVLSEEGLNHLVYSSRTPGEESLTANGSLSSISRSDFTNECSAPSVSTEPQAQATPSRDETARNTPAQDSTSSAQTGQACTCMATVDMGDLVPVESDETLLSIYKTQLSDSWPFVIIPAGTTSRQLQATRPFLMKVIRMVASVRHLRSVKGQSRAVMEHISHALLIRSERSLDLLQGILIFLGFYHYHCMAHAQFNNLIRLAVSLVEDLELNTCPNAQQRSQLPLARVEKPVSRTNEEKRALLGVWYMSSK